MKKSIFKVNEKYTWLREALLMRLPDGSLFCEIFTGGTHDGAKTNLVTAVRSDDDGESWSDLEIIRSDSKVGCWAGSVFSTEDHGYIFWLTLENGRDSMTNNLLSTGADGRTFDSNREIMSEYKKAPWQCVDIRRGTKLRDGRILLPAAWSETSEECEGLENKKLSEEEERRLINLGGAIRHKIAYCGVVEPNADFSEFKRFGRIHHLTPDGPTPSVPFFENQIVELSDGKLSMLIRGDLTNRLWRSDSHDGGYTWSEPVKTDILNPGTKPLVINLPNGRIVLFNSPNEKDYDDLESHHHAYRTPLEMWISDDDMKSWSVKKTISPREDGIAQYPDGFYNEKTGQIYLVWENDVDVFFEKITV
jgi:hypothetical protein